jgi:uracil phosphoribosyltransferase
MRQNSKANNGAFMDQSFSNLHIVQHPLIQHKLTMLRMEETKPGVFRQLLREITFLMAFDLFKDFSTKTVKIKTPISETNAQVLENHELTIVPVLRAGLVMADALRELVPTAKEGHIGLYRDPVTHRPVEYFVKLPSIMNQNFVLVDPMLATGYSAIRAIEILLEKGVDRRKIQFLSLLAVPEGIRAFNEKFSDIPIITAALDDHLNDHAYMVPGLGDAGDRLFGTQ